MNDPKGFKRLESEYLVFEEGDRIVFKGSGILSITPNNSKCIVVKNGCSYVLSLETSTNGSIKITFKSGNPRILGVFSESSQKKLNLGIKGYNDQKTFEFLENNDALLDSMYFEIPVDYDSLFLEKTLKRCMKLGIRNAFYVFKVSSEPESLLFLSSAIGFLEASCNVNQKIFVILEDVIDIMTRTSKGLEDCLFLFKDTVICPVFSVPFSPVKSPNFESKEEFVANLENLKKELIEAVSFLGNFPYPLACECSTETTRLSNDDWITYIFGAKCLSEALGSPETVIYNIPGGHSDNTKQISNFSRKVYKFHTETPKDFSSSAGLFFFGGENIQEQKNFWNDTIGETNLFPSHLGLVRDKGVHHLLFGPKNNAVDTECVPCKNNCYTVMDDNYILDSIKSNFF